MEPGNDYRISYGKWKTIYYSWSLGVGDRYLFVLINLFLSSFHVLPLEQLLQ
jgi:hypothetical protein